MDPNEVFTVLMTSTLKYREVLQHILGQLSADPATTDETRAGIQADLDLITAAIDQVYASGEAAANAAGAEADVDPLMPNSGGIYQNPPTPAS